MEATFSLCSLSFSFTVCPLEADDSTWVEDTEECALKWVQVHHVQVQQVQYVHV